MPYLERPGARIYYETHGHRLGTAPALVFAHGAGGNHLSWWQQVPHFRGRYSCVVFDHRGWGLSTESKEQTANSKDPAADSKEPTADTKSGGEAFVDDLRALLDHLEIERATLVAQSMGGWTSLGLAMRWPERVERLAMCDTHGGISSPGTDGVWKASAENAAKLPPGVHPAIGERMYREQPSLAFLYEEIDALNNLTRQQIFAAVLSAGAVPAADAARLSLPVLFVIGEEDIVIPPPFLEAAASAVPGARVVRVPEAGHSVYFERAERFNALLDAFVA
jgi:3-oxoadipate enol-lactonase